MPERSEAREDILALAPSALSATYAALLHSILTLHLTLKQELVLLVVSGLKGLKRGGGLKVQIAVIALGFEKIAKRRAKDATMG